MKKNAVVHLHSSEDMPEVVDRSVKLFMGPSVFLGKGVPWDAYQKLYEQVYVREGARVLRQDGVFLVIQTNAYQNGQVLCRYRLLLDMLTDWEMVDERVWLRRKADHFQPAFSHVLVMRPTGGSFSRNEPNKRSRAWFSGLWDYPQTKGSDCASYPESLCRMIVEACTDKGDLIVDPFAGSGMLLGVAAVMGRDAVGYEINRELIPLIRANGCDVTVDDRLLKRKPAGLLG